MAAAMRSRAAEPPRHRSGGAAATERVEHKIVGAGGGQKNTRKQRFGLLRRMQLLAVAALEPLLAGAKREEPVGPHLDIVVAGFERFVIEGVVACSGVARRPDQCFMRVGEAAATKVWHRVRLAPDNVVENPEPEVLKDCSDAKDVVVGTDDPQSRVRLH
jgi:hypothetical protein